MTARNRNYMQLCWVVPDLDAAIARWLATTGAGPFFVFEDVHWADDSMLAFLDHLDSHLQDAPILVVCTARPELQDSPRRWVSFRYGTLRLSALAEDAISSLIDDLTVDMEVPPALRTRLLEQCGGNPLYAEELVRALVSLRASRVSGSMPWAAWAMLTDISWVTAACCSMAAAVPPINWLTS